MSVLEQKSRGITVEEETASSLQYSKVYENSRWFNSIKMRSGKTCLLGFKMMGAKPADGTLYFFVGSDKLRFRQPVVPGDQLTLEASFISAKRGIWKFDCRASVDGKPVCSAEIICAEQKI